MHEISGVDERSCKRQLLLFDAVLILTGVPQAKLKLIPNLVSDAHYRYSGYYLIIWQCKVIALRWD